MNERIRLLAEQCYETGPIGKDGWPEYSKFNEEKFAKLIVRECESIVDNYGRWILYDKLAVKVKQHFGVEE